MKKEKMNRQEANVAIIAKLNEYILKNPNIRFCQALQNIDINIRNGRAALEDTFYEEPQETLDRVLSSQYFNS